MAKHAACILMACVVILIAHSAGRAQKLTAIENHNLLLVGQEETAEVFIERVKQSIKNEEWGRARAGLKHALALKKDYPEAYFLFAQVFWHDGERGMAIEALDEGLKYEPINPEIRLMLARYLAEAFNLKRAREEANLAIGQGAPRFVAYRLLGELEFRESNYEAAVASFETALQYMTADDELEFLRLQRRINALKEFMVIRAEQNAANIVRPVPLNSSAPKYTDEARAQKIQGRVVLAVRVGESGEVIGTYQLGGLGYGLDDAAGEAVRQLKFSPATKEGKPIKYWTRVEVEFNLK